MTGPEAARRLMASPLLRRVADALAGEMVFLTGGSLRDRLLGLPTHDIDLMVLGDAGAAAQRLARRLGGTRFSLGRPPRRSWRVLAAGRQLDLVGAADLETDIRRRDFTVNALVFRLARGPLVDLVGGLDDLAAGRVRVVREANLREDPLRVLRGIRLTATRPQLKLTADTERLLSAAAPGLTRVASERVVDELRLLLGGPGVERALLVAARCAILTPLFPAWGQHERLAEVAALAARLALLAGRRTTLGEGARAVAPAVLAAPAAGLPERFETEPASAALAAVGWPPRAARAAARAAGMGERLLPLLARDRAASRALAAEAGELLPAALAWAAARRGDGDTDTAAATGALLRWARRFALRPPLLAGEEVASLLSLPAGPARARAVSGLREAQARGELRTPAQARRWLRQP